MRVPASQFHEGDQAFLRRALHFAMREVSETPRVVPLPVTWLAYLLCYRAGMPVDALAAAMGVSRRHIARRLIACMAVRGVPAVNARIEALVAEMGRINFEPRDGKRLRFPGPSSLAPQRTMGAIV
jgi:hypothetical protein